jgi:DNA end-binding protein Ku
LDSIKVESSSVMTIVKFVDASSIDLIYYDAPTFWRRRAKPGATSTPCCEAVAETGRVALARVVIGQRERTIGIRAVEGGLVVHTLDERRDINDARSVFGNAAEMTPDPEMVALAKQLIDRQTSRYDPSDLEDHYEIRLRAMIDAKLKGAGIEAGAEPAPDCSNVVDLMAALKKSLGELQPSQSVNRRSLRLTRQRQNRSVLRLRRPSHRAS